MRRNLPKNKLLNICVVTLFFAVSFAGCVENNEEDAISPNDVVVNPVTLVAGEFQPLIISVKRDVSVFVPHMVVGIKLSAKWNYFRYENWRNKATYNSCPSKNRYCIYLPIEIWNRDLAN